MLKTRDTIDKGISSTKYQFVNTIQNISYSWTRTILKYGAYSHLLLHTANHQSLSGIK